MHPITTLIPKCYFDSIATNPTIDKATSLAIAIPMNPRTGRPPSQNNGVCFGAENDPTSTSTDMGVTSVGRQPSY